MPGAPNDRYHPSSTTVGAVPNEPRFIRAYAYYGRGAEIVNDLN